MGTILSLSEFYKLKLDAPMINNRWSWGAVKKDNSAVYLSVWQDEIRRDEPKNPDSSTWVDVLWDEDKWRSVNGGETARSERIDHINLIKSGTPAFALIKIAKDTNQIPREMKEFISEYLIEIINNFRTSSDGRVQVEIGKKVWI